MNRNILAVAAAALGLGVNVPGRHSIERARYRPGKRVDPGTRSRGIRKKCDGCGNIMFERQAECYRCRTGQGR